MVVSVDITQLCYITSFHPVFFFYRFFTAAGNARCPADHLCSDICLMLSANQSVCSCLPGRVLSPDGYTCTSCSTAQMACSNTHCISQELACDGVPHCTDASDENEEFCGKAPHHSSAWCNAVSCNVVTYLTLLWSSYIYIYLEI